MVSSVFSVIRKGRPVEMFALRHAYLLDKVPDKVDLAIGFYQNNEGRHWVFPVVRKVEMQVAKNPNFNHQYLPVLGDLKLRDSAVKLLLGDDSKVVKEKRALCIQTLAGTGAMQVGASFLRSAMCRKKFMYSDPLAENYCQIFMSAGFEKVSRYKYWKKGKPYVNFDGILESMCDACPGTVVVLHACGHNPTGMELKKEQWKELAKIMQNKQLFPFFDCTNQGLSTGNPDKDAWPVRYFAEKGFEMLVAQSFVKSFGLYGERLGCLTVIQNTAKTTDIIKSRLNQLVRGMYNSPPAFAAEVVSRILNDKCLKMEWLGVLSSIAQRLKKNRRDLADRFDEMETCGTWYGLRRHRGLYSVTGLCESHVNDLIKDYHIYMPKDGRINISAINEKNFDYITDSIHRVVMGLKKKPKPCSTGGAPAKKPATAAKPAPKPCGTSAPTPPKPAVKPPPAPPKPNPVAGKPAPAPPKPNPVAAKPSPAPPKPNPVAAKPPPAPPKPKPVAAKPPPPPPPKPAAPKTPPVSPAGKPPAKKFSTHQVRHPSPAACAKRVDQRPTIFYSEDNDSLESKRTKESNPKSNASLKQKTPPEYEED